MKFSGKIILLAAGVAVLSSALTAGVIREVFTSGDDFSSISTGAGDMTGNGGGFYTVGLTPNTATDFTSAAESSINGVVSIKSFVTKRESANNGGFFGGDIFEYFFGFPGGGQRQQPQYQEEPQESEQQLGLGSGVILTPDGYIVTNNHVIDKAERLEVTLNDNRTFDATVIGTDPSSDLALIKIDATDLPIIPMGDSEALKVGEWVLAVGNPFGFTSTVTTGIVSAKARSIGGNSRNGRPMSIESYIQTDAAVNPGNSGGALVNLEGQLIGINTAIYSQTGNYAGYSFAVPTSIVKKVVSDIRQYGTVQRAILGIAGGDLNSELAKEKGITAVTQGVYVSEVSSRSAKEAGLQSGDVIVAVNGKPTDKMTQLHEQIAKHRPGDKVKVDFIRDNVRKSTEVQLLNPKGTTNLTKAVEFTDLGCEFKKASANTLRQLGLQGGVQVVELGNGIMRDAGVKNGFIITSINKRRVATPADVENIYRMIMKSENVEREMVIRGCYPDGKVRGYWLDLSGDQ
ncbi:MAG: trypsin-like peptidase domain-containing protein [Paenibacillus sp.]|nr:trypsin-like peptidase domain-containing protein [Paenibacillus sp.]